MDRVIYRQNPNKNRVKIALRALTTSPTRKKETVISLTLSKGLKPRSYKRDLAMGRPLPANDIRVEVI